MAAQQAEMEDIISSIRTTLAEETAKVSGAKPDAAGPEEVLELTADEMIEPAAKSGEEGSKPAGDDDLVDIAAFAGTGESKPAGKAAAAGDVLGEEAPAVAAQPAAAEAKAAESDEFDQLLAQISEEQKKHIAAAEEQKKALMAAEEPLGAPVQAKPTPVAEPVKANGTALHVQAAADDMSVTLPAEVLAMALRPMVQEWLEEHLAGVVEKLVQAELDKLNQA